MKAPGICRNRIIAYGLLAVGMLLAVGLYSKHSDDQLRRDAALDCRRANAVARNQKLVLRTLIADRKNEPGYLLYAHPAARKRSIAELHQALHAVPVYDCK